MAAALPTSRKARLGLLLGIAAAVVVPLVALGTGSRDRVSTTATTSETPDETTPATVLGTVLERSGSSEPARSAPPAPVAPLEAPTTAPAPTDAPTTTPPPPEPAVPASPTVTVDVAGDDRLARVNVRLDGPGGARLAEVTPTGGQASFGALEPGEYELYVDYEYVPAEPGPGGAGGSAQGIDRSGPFVLEPGGALHATWSQATGWAL